MTYFKKLFREDAQTEKWLSWDRKNYICPQVTETESIFGHRIGYGRVGVPWGQRHWTQVTPHPPLGDFPAKSLKLRVTLTYPGFPVSL